MAPTATGPIVRKKHTGEPGNAGEFGGLHHSEPDLALEEMPRTVTVLNNRSEPVTLQTDTFGYDAEDVFAQGQCGAFAAAIHEFAGGTIKIGTAQGGRVLVHVWVSDSDGFMTDARGFSEPCEEDFLTESCYQWGTIDVEEMTRDELVTYLSGDDIPNTQGWAAAELMVPAYLKAHHVY